MTLGEDVFRGALVLTLATQLFDLSPVEAGIVVAVGMLFGLYVHLGEALRALVDNLIPVG